jgi:ribosome maturation factor RimP
VKSEKLIQEITEIIEPILMSQGIELVDLEYQREAQGWVLRVTIDREGGVTIENCTQVSGEVSVVLEVRDIIPNAYVLEVSSPGLTRRLKKREDFEKCRSRLVKIRTFEPIDGQRNFMGILRGMEGESVRLEVGTRVQEIPFQAIAKANLEVEF